MVSFKVNNFGKTLDSFYQIPDEQCHAFQRNLLNSGPNTSNIWLYTRAEFGKRLRLKDCNEQTKTVVQILMNILVLPSLAMAQATFIYLCKIQTFYEFLLFLEKDNFFQNL